MRSCYRGDVEAICGQSKQVRNIKQGEGGSKSAVYFPMSKINKARCELPATVIVGGVLLVGDWRPDGAPLSFFLSPSLSLPLSLRLSLSVPIKLLVVLTHHSPLSSPRCWCCCRCLCFPFLLLISNGVSKGVKKKKK